MLAPSVDIELSTEEQDLETSKTYKLDTENGKISGRIDEMTALQQAIFKILSTERFMFLIYETNYGIEKFELLNGNYPEDFIKTELSRVIKEALLEDDRIISVYDFSFEFGLDSVVVSFEVGSVFGETEITKEF